MQRLVEFLPTSIETLEMTSKYVGTGLSKKDVSGMFMGLPEPRYVLPKLLKIKVEWEKNRQSKVEKEGWEEMCLRCKESSIELFCQRSETLGGICVQITRESCVVLPMKPVPSSTFQQGGTITYTGLELLWSRKVEPCELGV